MDTPSLVRNPPLAPSPMSLLCLNYRGLGATQAVSNLRSLLCRLVPTVVFPSETKKTKTEIKALLDKLGNYRGIFIDARRRSSGFGLLWMETATVDFHSCSMHRINVTIKWEGEDVTWRFSGVYGWPGS